MVTGQPFFCVATYTSVATYKYVVGYTLSRFVKLLLQKNQRNMKIIFVFRDVFQD